MEEVTGSSPVSLIESICGGSPPLAWPSVTPAPTNTSDDSGEAVRNSADVCCAAHDESKVGGDSSSGRAGRGRVVDRLVFSGSTIVRGRTSERVLRRVRVDQRDHAKPRGFREVIRYRLRGWQGPSGLAALVLPPRQRECGRVDVLLRAGLSSDAVFRELHNQCSLSGGLCREKNEGSAEGGGIPREDADQNGSLRSLMRMSFLLTNSSMPRVASSRP